MLRFQVSVQILISLIFYSSRFILLIFHSCMHLQSAGVFCDCCDCIVSQECDSVTSALFQRLRQSVSLVLSRILTGYGPRQLPCNFHNLEDLEDQSPTGLMQACTKPFTISHLRESTTKVSQLSNIMMLSNGPH